MTLTGAHGLAASATAVACGRAEILAQVGDAGAAVDELKRLLVGPSFVTIHVLRLDPLWDPIRSDPRFQALAARGGS